MSAELHAMGGAYALDALDERERAAFEAHLTGCPTCTVELAEFRATAARLSDAVATRPPASLRDSVLATASRTAQERPVVPLRHPVPRWRRQAPMLAAAAATVVVVGAVGAYVHEHGQLTDLQDRDRREAAVMVADDADAFVTETGGTTVKVVSSESMDGAVVLMRGVPRLEDGRSYQLWALDNGRAESLGVMGNDDVGGTTSHLVEGLSGAEQVAVTVEPEGGSDQPSQAPVLSVELA